MTLLVSHTNLSPTLRIKCAIQDVITPLWNNITATSFNLYVEFEWHVHESVCIFKKQSWNYHYYPSLFAILKPSCQSLSPFVAVDNILKVATFAELLHQEFKIHSWNYLKAWVMIHGDKMCHICCVVKCCIPKLSSHIKLVKSSVILRVIRINHHALEIILGFLCLYSGARLPHLNHVPSRGAGWRASRRAGPGEPAQLCDEAGEGRAVKKQSSQRSLFTTLLTHTAYLASRTPLSLLR